MKVQTKIQKWGNGLALRVSGVMRDLPHFQAGTPVEVEVGDDGFTVTRIVRQQRPIFPFNESELLRDMTEEQAHAHAIASPFSSELGE